MSTYSVFRTSLDTPIKHVNITINDLNNGIAAYNDSRCEMLTAQYQSTFKHMDNSITPRNNMAPLISPITFASNYADQYPQCYLQCFGKIYIQPSSASSKSSTRSSFSSCNSSTKDSIHSSLKNSKKNPGNRVKFEPTKNKITFINDHLFYQNDNIKRDVWWTADELNNMRKLFTIEVNRLKIMNPSWSIGDCIREICNR